MMPQSPNVDHYLTERIREALASDHRVGELDVQVAISGNKVFLTGTVATDERRRAMSELVEELAPGHEVHNQTVLMTAASGDVEQLS